ncbi:hypothetical protein [Sphingomonas glacialis]|uniref:hypothetical protein n=1 Tax=Sphingomonas glacialis TaxID=658225 RepID=UPI001128A21F|nr:hypothetical protein [Sphingomonas glacialis]
MIISTKISDSGERGAIEALSGYADVRRLQRAKDAACGTSTSVPEHIRDDLRHGASEVDWGQHPATDYVDYPAKGLEPGVSPTSAWWI